MAIPAPILPDDLLRPVFRARLLLYLFGLAIAVAVVAAGGPPILLPLLLGGAALAWWQLRNNALHIAWAVDSLVAVAVASVQETPIGVAIVIGWGGIIGLVDEQRSWVYPTGTGLAAAGAAMLAPSAEVAWALEPMLRVLTVVVVGVFFVLMFRRVGDLLRSNERELRSFFQRVPVALTRTAPDGTLLEFNNAVADLFHDPKLGEQVAGRYADPDDRNRFVDALLADGIVHNFEATFVGGLGNRIDALISANAVQGAGGELRYIETAITDITKLRRAEAARELLARVIDSTSDFVVLLNWDGAVRYANAAAREWMKRHVTDDEYVHSSQPLTSEDYERVQLALREAGQWSGTLSIQGRDRVRTVDASFQVIEMAGDYTVATIARDVSDEVDTQRRLEELVAAKDELVASISHEIRTPLSVVLGLASELRDSGEEFDEATHHEFSALIAEQGQEMAHIVEDLLVAARADTGTIVLDLARVDLRHEVEMTLRSISQSDQPHDIYNTVTGSCWGDPSRIRQILRNLIVNAKRHGGDQVRLASESAGGRVSIEVADNGAGVTEDRSESIFEPFERATGESSQPASIGLGLSVSRDLAKRMGGDLTYSRRNGFTVFTLTLPGSAGRLD